MKLTVLLFSLLAGCATTVKETGVLTFPPLAAVQDPLFPYGDYLHHVSLHILRTENGKPADFEFEGVAKTTADAIHLVILSPFHTTLMKVDESRVTGKVTLQIFEERIRKYQDKFAGYYSLLRKIMALKNSATTNGALNVTLEDPKGVSKVTLDQFKNKIPGHIRVENAFYTLNIEVEPVHAHSD